MKDLYAGGISNTALIGAALCLLTVSPGPASAQGGGSRAREVERRIDILKRQGEQYERDRLSRDHKDSAEDPGDRRRAQDLAEQVKRDFEGLQAGYNKIVIVMVSRERLDYDSISDAVVEVKKCAARLRDNLALPRTKDDEGGKTRSEVGAARLEESLLTLRKHIYSFVTNPLFEAPAVLDVEQAGKAGRDLDVILELSESIRRSGGRLKGRQD